MQNGCQAAPKRKNSGQCTASTSFGSLDEPDPQATEFPGRLQSVRGNILLGSFRGTANGRAPNSAMLTCHRDDIGDNSFVLSDPLIQME